MSMVIMTDYDLYKKASIGHAMKKKIIRFYFFYATYPLRGCSISHPEHNTT